MAPWHRASAAQRTQPPAEKLRPRQWLKTKSAARPIRPTVDSRKRYRPQVSALWEAEADRDQTTDWGVRTRDSELPRDTLNLHEKENRCRLLTKPPQRDIKPATPPSKSFLISR